MFPNLRAEMARGGWKTRELAKKIGISTSALQLKLKGEREFKLREMVEILAALGCSDMTLDWLFERAEG